MTSRLTTLLSWISTLVLLSTSSAQAQTFRIETTNPNNGPMSAAWYNANESGWGILTSQRADVMFAAMFTYDEQGKATWYVASPCNISRDGCSGDFYAVTGGVGPVVPWNASNLSTTRVGAFSMTFRDADNGSVSFSINGVNGSKAITRTLWGAQTQPASKLAWQKPNDLNAGLPAGVEVFRGSGDGLQAVYAVLDKKLNANIDWFVQSTAPGVKTASEFARDETKRAYVTINGGYFGASSVNQSYSLVVKDGVQAAPGIKQLTRTGGAYFPTRAAFGANATGEITVTWAYPVGTGNSLYNYPLPSPNDAAKAPKQVPDANFPAGATPWQPNKAIGGGPMLLQRGSKLITATEEVFDASSGINAGGAAPRTAIARLKDDRVLLLVVDGRSAASRGVALTELADILLSLGATDAINLDGGGSSTMIVNGVVANVPSDGVQRQIPSVVMFRDR